MWPALFLLPSFDPFDPNSSFLPIDSSSSALPQFLFHPLESWWVFYLPFLIVTFILSSLLSPFLYPFLSPFLPIFPPWFPHFLPSFMSTPKFPFLVPLLPQPTEFIKNTHFENLLWCFQLTGTKETDIYENQRKLWLRWDCMYVFLFTDPMLDWLTHRKCQELPQREKKPLQRHIITQRFIFQGWFAFVMSSLVYFPYYTSSLICYQSLIKQSNPLIYYKCSCRKLILCVKHRCCGNLRQIYKYMTQQCGWEEHGQIKQICKTLRAGPDCLDWTDSQALQVQRREDQMGVSVWIQSKI